MDINESHAQKNDEREKYRWNGNPSIDTTKKTPFKWLRFRPTEKFDLVWNKGFPITGEIPDSVPISSASSGTHFVGVSFNYMMNNRLSAKAIPGFSFVKYSYKQNTTKSFPTVGDTLIDEKIRSEYFTLPLALSYAFQIDTLKGKIRSFIEIGTSLSFKLGSNYKINYEDDDGLIRKMKISGIPDINPFRFCIYTKLVYRFVGIWAMYRITSYYKKDSLYKGKYPYPKMPSIELGFSLVI